MADDDSTQNPYEARQQARKERFEELAAKAKAESAAAFKRSGDLASVIPFGQPILVGHHSEKGDRAYRAKIHRLMDKSCELSGKAKHYEQKAASVGMGGISSDDPEAVKKLAAELAGLEVMQERMKKANAFVRKNDREGLAAMGYDDKRIAQLFTADFCGRIGFPDYALTNNSANMRRIRLRIEQLRARPTETTERTETSRSMLPVTIREDATENRVMLIFPGKPSEAVRSILKANGFKWSPNRGAWVRFLNNAGRAAAQYALQQIKAAG